jgi:hypothetical protein
LFAALFAWFCFFSFAVAGPLSDRDEVEVKDLALWDWKIPDFTSFWKWKGGGSGHGKGKGKGKGCSKSVGKSGMMQVRLSTCQGRIDWGESAELKWRCEKAQTCELIPDVGPLNPNGFGTVNVSPKKTTKYILIGKRPGGIAKASVTITVVNIPPTISIIQPADGSTLPHDMFDNVPVEIEFSDDVGIDPGSFGARINDLDITDRFTVTDSGATCVLTMRLPVGSNTLSVTIGNVEGLTVTAKSHFTNPDTDGDGMPDGWEVQHGLDPSVDDAGADMDGDGLSNLAEFQSGTNPHNGDTDGDGMPDGWEVQYGLDPLADDAQEDLDGDGFSNGVEYNAGTEPNNADSKPAAYQIDFDKNGNMLRMQQP